jgi:hypothetical protein
LAFAPALTPAIGKTEAARDALFRHLELRINLHAMRMIECRFLDVWPATAPGRNGLLHAVDVAEIAVVEAVFHWHRLRVGRRAAPLVSMTGRACRAG